MCVGDGVVSSADSDWGTGPEDNAPDDVYAVVADVARSDYGAGVTFTCDNLGCVDAE